MENNKPTIEDDIKNISSKIKTQFKDTGQFLDFNDVKQLFIVVFKVLK
jgi:hypothetical protein